MQNYFTSENELSIDDKKFLYKCRKSDLDIRGNRKWKYKNITCISCEENIIENTRHLFECEKLICGKKILKKSLKYDDIFGENIEKQYMVLKILKENYEKRKQFL